MKAGSKVYVPNGSGVFDTVMISSDLTITYSHSDTRQLMVFYDITISGLRLRYVDECFSGTSTPVANNNEVWYNTTNNIIKFSNDTGSTWSRQYSFPLCIITVNSTQITSIDQVFNGFGYIGSTVFALPGVEGLIPDGFDGNGNRKNVKIITDKVQTYYFDPAWGKLDLYLVLGKNNFYCQPIYRCGYDKIITHNDGDVYYQTYDRVSNYNYDTVNTGSSWYKIDRMLLKFTKISFDGTKPGITYLDKSYNLTVLDDKSTPHIVETYRNGTSWYRVYSDGWCEQGGKVSFTTDALHEVTLYKAYTNTNYSIQLTLEGQYSSTAYPKFWSIDASSKATGSFKVFGAANAGLREKYWEAKGYIS